MVFVGDGPKELQTASFSNFVADSLPTGDRDVGACTKVAEPPVLAVDGLEHRGRPDPGRHLMAPWL